MTNFPLKITLAFALALIISCSSSDEDDSKLNTVKKERVTGISQKGPFARDSKVTIYELNAKFGKTKNRSEGKTDGDGSFDIKIKNGELASPYIILEANGRYLNEVSGEVTTTPITLNAIADVSSKSKVNINILTHLEFERVLELVKGGKSFSAAKKQAQREVLAALGIDIGERGIMNSELLDIFGSGTGDAILLVVSILFQGNRSVEEVSSLLGKFSGEIRDKGTSKSIIDEVKKGLEEVDIEKVKDYVWNQNPDAREPDISPYLPPKPPEIPLSSAFNSSANSVSPSPSPSPSPGGNSGQRRSSSSLAALQSSTSEHSSSSGEHSSSSDEEHSSSSHTSSSSSEAHSSSSEEHSSSSFVCTAANNTATQYCSNGTMKTYGSVTDGSRSYKTVEIGTQVWMAENLNSFITGSNASKCYGNDFANCDKYGSLYNWDAAKMACPPDWHLPSDADWNTLMKFVNPSCTDNSDCAGAGTKLKATAGWNFDAGTPAGTDDYGFSALPGGFGYSGGSFYNVGYYGTWWSASESNSYSAYYRDMGYYYEYVNYYYYDKDYLYSVRCLQD
jgi:uncharacterized protein (TIGR02145 family)